MQPASLSEIVDRYYTPEQKAFLAYAVRRTPPPLWKPLPGPQTLAYESKADIIGYGGSAGGGKTDLALGMALNRHKRSIVFRKNGTEHTAFVDRITEIIGNRDRYSSKDGVWRDLGPRNIQLEFGSVPNMGDEEKYRGRPHDLKIFDEAAEIPESQIRFLMGWMRTTDPTVKCQALLCFNPPRKAQGRWVMSYFAPWLDPKHPNPAAPGELRWFASIDGRDTEVVSGNPFDHNGETILPQSRTFIPARVTDNPYLVGTSYMTTLQALPEPLRSQMLYGDFNAGIEDDPWQVIPTAWVEAAMARWVDLPRKPEMDSIGCDVARGGRDNTIIARRHGTWFDKPLVYPGTETPDGPTVCGLVVAASRDRAPQHIDVIGVGASPYDFLKQANQPVVGVNVAEASTATDKSGRLRFTNLRSQLWWRMREALDPANNQGIALPPDDRLKTDLCTPEWRLRGSAIQVESREDIVKDTGRSPDYASAYILALMHTPKTTGGHLADGLTPGRHTTRKGPYDPYSNVK